MVASSSLMKLGGWYPARCKGANPGFFLQEIRVCVQGCLSLFARDNHITALSMVLCKYFYFVYDPTKPLQKDFISLWEWKQNAFFFLWGKMWTWQLWLLWILYLLTRKEMEQGWCVPVYHVILESRGSQTLLKNTPSPTVTHILQAGCLLKPDIFYSSSFFIQFFEL